jgi:hypothetical protein
VAHEGAGGSDVLFKAADEGDDALHRDSGSNEDDTGMIGNLATGDSEVVLRADIGNGVLDVSVGDILDVGTLIAS